MIVAVVMIVVIAVEVMAASILVTVVSVYMRVTMVVGTVSVVVLRKYVLREIASNEEGRGDGNDDLLRHIFHFVCKLFF